MLAASLQTQTEARLVQQNIRNHQQHRRHEHEPVELEAIDIHQKRLFDVDVGNGGGHIRHIFGNVDGLDDDRRRRRAEQVHRRADERLVCLEVNCRDRQQERIQHPENHRHQRRQEDDHDDRRAVGHVLHHQRTAKRTENHDALQPNVNHAGMLREAAAQRHQQQD